MTFRPGLKVIFFEKTCMGSGSCFWAKLAVFRWGLKVYFSSFLPLYMETMPFEINTPIKPDIPVVNIWGKPNKPLSANTFDV